MFAMRKNRTAALLALGVTTALCAAANAAVLQDNFNNNAAEANWAPFNAGTTKVSETAHRLCFRSTSDTVGFRRAGYNSNSWTYRGHLNATIKFDYNVNVASLAGSEQAAVGVYTIEPDDASSLEVLVYQKASGWFVELELFVDEGSGLNSVLRQVKPISSGTGTVEVKYVKSTDTMTVKVNGQNKITVPNLNNGYGPFDLEVQLFGSTTKTSCAYGDLWMDNFSLQGTLDGI